MHKDPERRYQSAEQFAEDVGRYLRGETVSARPDTLLYRTTRMVRRNPLAFGALGLLVLSLSAGLAATLYQAQRAERRFAQVRKLANSFLFDFHDRIQHLPGSTDARAFVVKTGLAYLDSLAAEAANDISLKAELAEAYARVANVQGGPRGSNLGQVEQAAASYRKAIRLLEEIPSSSRAPAQLRLLSDAHGLLGDLESSQGRPAEGLAHARRAAELAEQAAGGSDKPEDRMFLAQTHTRLGDVLSEDAPREARREYETAIAILESLLARTPAMGLKLRAVQTYDRLGRVAHASGDARAAVAQYDKALPIAEQVLRENPEDARVRRFLSVLFAMRGAYRGHPDYFHLGDPAGAEHDFLTSLKATREAVARDPNDALAAADLALDHSRLARVYEAGRPEQSLAEAAACMQVMDRIVTRDPKNFRAARVRANCLGYSSRALRRMGRLREALPLAEEHERSAARLLAQSPRDLGAIETRVVALHQTCLVLADLRDWPAAEMKCKESLRLAEEQTAARPEDLFFLRDAAQVAETLARIDRGRGDAGKARENLERSLEMWRRFAGLASTTVVSQEGITRVQKALAELPRR
jgi:tetratricopeptide (TPR) repeat protein